MSGAAEAVPVDEPRVRSRGYLAQTLRRLARQPVTLAAATVVGGLFVTGAFAGRIAPEGWNLIDLSDRWHSHPPTLADRHFLGTDNIGRDVLVRTLSMKLPQGCGL